MRRKRSPLVQGGLELKVQMLVLWDDKQNIERL